MCRDGRLYDVEEWIRQGRPLQLAPQDATGGRKRASALEIALERGNHALTLLLLCNGYDPNAERYSSLDIPLRDRRIDLVDLLLSWGAGPHDVCLDYLFDTYDSKLFERFRALGVDLTADRAMARALGEHTSNKPLYGFARRHRTGDTRMQAELNTALAHHASEGNQRGVELCLWAGADPRAPARSLRYWMPQDDDGDEDDDDRFLGFSALWEACSRGHVEIVERFGPDPVKDDFDALYLAARSRPVIRLLAQSALPGNVGAGIDHHARWASHGFSRWESVEPLREVFEIGARWTKGSPEQIAAVRWSLLKVPKDAFVDLMKLLTKDDYCAPEILRELARTAAMRRRLRNL